MALMQRIFPKLENTIYGADWVVKWRRDQRVCVPALFPTYFRLAVAPSEIRRSEMIALLALVDTPEQLGQALVDAAHEKRPDGVSRVRALLERLMDYVEKDIPEHHIPTVINVLLDVGDSLVLPDDERGTFDFGNESRVTRVVYHLLKREEQPQRLNMLRDAFNAGRGIGVQCYLLVALLDEVAKQAQGGSESLMDAASLEELKAIWIGKVRAAGDTLLMNTQFPRLLSAWREWADTDDGVHNLCASLTASDDGLLTFLPHFCSHTRSQTMGDWAVRIQPRLNPTWIENTSILKKPQIGLSRWNRQGKCPSLPRRVFPNS